jgi:hypothetical protein
MKAVLYLLVYIGCVSSFGIEKERHSFLKGNQKVGYHMYAQLKDVLDEFPVFCGIPGSFLDLTRITAVQGLEWLECGTVLKVTSDAFKYLNNGIEQDHLVHVKWEPINSLHGKDIITKGEFELPGYEDGLKLPY